MTLDAVLGRIDDGLPEALERLTALLRIPSISTDPAYAPDCDRAADWLVADLREVGFEAAKHPTPGHPMVVAHYGADRGAGPHYLFYGHYDVQPVDPLDLWDRDPFDPAIEETPSGRVIRARGASDDKGQLMTFIEACRAIRAETGTLPCRLTVFLEGEEESGSPSLVPFMEANRDALTCDLALICDTGLFESTVPAIVTMLRGLLGEEVTVRGPSKDLHSGMYGGAAMNPIRVLSRVIASLHDDEGRITVPGFYDGVEELSDEVRAQWQSLAFDHAAFLGGVGLSVPAGEQDRTPLEMLWSRPTCEVNGIWGGYTGAGFKTVLPAEAHAKISFRLVGRQDPGRHPRGLPRARPHNAPRRLHGGVPRPRCQPRGPHGDRPPGVRGRPRRIERGMGPARGIRGLRRLDPDRGLLPHRARHGRDAGGLRARRRPDPLAQREVRRGELPQGHPVLGADPGRARRLSADAPPWR